MDLANADGAAVVVAGSATVALLRWVYRFVDRLLQAQESRATSVVEVIRANEPSIQALSSLSERQAERIQLLEEELDASRREIRELDGLVRSAHGKAHAAVAAKSGLERSVERLRLLLDSQRERANALARELMDVRRGG
ncbi:MAG: putative RNase H-like nuclease (RuvC/YqgF family) [Bradymonadia bacterium]|jgi:predicted RNase H-like nuclease (RuvC/YqgF family)